MKVSTQVTNTAVEMPNGATKKASTRTAIDAGEVGGNHAEPASSFERSSASRAATG
jgi:hypothetical protein